MPASSSDMNFEPLDAVAICIGVEDYTHLPRIAGATKSASMVFEALTQSENALCNSEKSRLLLNPSYGEFHRFLESYTYLLKPSDYVFFYFCGRTELVNGKSVLCLRDSVRLKQGIINPFTVQGWQSFFQLAQVAQVKGAILLWDAFNASPSKNADRSFINSLRQSREQTRPCRRGSPGPYWLNIHRLKNSLHS